MLISFGFTALALMLAALPTNAGLVITLGLLVVGYTLSGIPDLTGAAAQGAVVGSWSVPASSPTTPGRRWW